MKWYIKLKRKDLNLAWKAGWVVLLWESRKRSGIEWDHWHMPLNGKKPVIASSDWMDYIQQEHRLELGRVTWCDRGQHFRFASKERNIRRSVFRLCWWVASFGRSSCPGSWLSQARSKWSQTTCILLDSLGRRNGDCCFHSEPSLAFSTVYTGFGGSLAQFTEVRTRWKKEDQSFRIFFSETLRPWTLKNFRRWHRAKEGKVEENKGHHYGK